ncbi:hypothetical protein HYR99_32450 [Candidatus Poribacteria bacterium]|nr:hypothetical protein [Candidatus Poribacteria bacterium]
MRVTRLKLEEIVKLEPPELANLIFQRFKQVGHKSLNRGDELIQLREDYNNVIQIPLKELYCRNYQEAWSILLRRGLIMPAWGKEQGHHFTITSVGEKSNFHDGILLLVDDAQEIVNSVKRESALDSVVEQYYLESLRAYQEDLYIASVICLGAASERAIHCLADAVVRHDSAKYGKKIENKKKQSIFDLTEYLRHSVIDFIFRGIVDEEFTDQLKDRLDRIAKIYRENRNQAGHPPDVPKKWSRADQEICLLQFRAYINIICKAIHILDSP